MANSISPIFGKILSRSLLSLRKAVKLPRLVDNNYSTEAAQFGDAITVRVPTRRDAIDVVPGPNQPTPTDRTTPAVNITLDQWKSADFFLTDREEKQIDKNLHFVPQEMNEAIDAIAREINGHLFSKVKAFGGYNGTPGADSVVPFASDYKAIVASRRALNEQDCPELDRYAVIDYAAEENAIQLAEFADASKSDDSGPIIQGEIGRKLGFQWFADSQVPAHTAGTATGKTVNNDPDGYPIGYTGAITVTTGSGTVLVGDLVKFAGHNIGYSVKATTASTVTLYQPLYEAVAHTEALTFMNYDHAWLNVAFSRRAVGFATRTLVDTGREGQTGTYMTMTDPISGLVLRLETVRQHKQTKWEFDVLYGGEVVQPGMGARIIAQS